MKNSNQSGNSWKDYFALSNRLTKSLLRLFIILFIVETCILVYLYVVPDRKAIPISENFKTDADRFFSVDNTGPKAEENNLPKEAGSLNPFPQKVLARAELFPFNPNNLPVADWMRLGFTEKQVRVIKNYESKGGRFYSKADVKKMYSISEESYNRIEPYIVIPTPVKDTVHKKENRENQVSTKPETPFLLVDINTADTTEFEKLYGIGPVKARIIFNYREKLGGFYSIKQIREVWGIDDSLFEILKPHLVLGDTNHLRKKNLNSTDPAELKHPYINYNLVNAIVNFHKQHGAFNSIEDVRKVPLVTDEIYAKISHYLEVKN